MKTPIQKLLFERGISQAEVARQLGITDKSASMKLSGKKELWWSKVAAICELAHIENPLEVFPAKGNERAQDHRRMQTALSNNKKPLTDYKKRLSNNEKR